MKKEVKILPVTLEDVGNVSISYELRSFGFNLKVIIDKRLGVLAQTVSEKFIVY